MYNIVPRDNNALLYTYELIKREKLGNKIFKRKKKK